MKRNIVGCVFGIILALWLPSYAVAQEKQLFDGGMMVHTGYLHGEINALEYKAAGATFGLGGVLRFHLGKHFRIGGEGYVSTLRQMHNGSYIRTGWGGFLADFYWRFGRWQPFAGLAVGGGKTNTLLLFEGSPDDWESETKAVMHRKGFCFVNPNVGVEFALTEAVHLTFKVDRLIPLTRAEMPNGVRFYFGVVFAH